MAETYDFTVKIDGVMRDYQVDAESEEQAMVALLQSLQSSANLSGKGMGVVVLVAAGVAIALFYLARKYKAGGGNPGLFGGGGKGEGIGDGDGGGNTFKWPKKKDKAEGDLEDDGPQKQEPEWPWTQVIAEDFKALGAGPLEHLDTSYTIWLFTDEDPPAELRSLARPYIPKTEDTEETAGVIVLVVPLEYHGKFELPDGGSFEYVLSEDAQTNEKYQYADVRATSLPELLKLAQEVQNETLGTLWA